MKSDQLCECLCGEYTDIAVKTDARRGYRKGDPMRFIAGHTSKNGKAWSAQAKPVLSNVGLRPRRRDEDELDELKIRSLRSLADGDAALILTERLKFLEKQFKRNYIERGFILFEVEERALWKHIINADISQPYTSFDRWVCGEAPQSRADAFESLRAVKQLRDMPRAELMNVPRKNVGILMQLSTKVRDNPEVIKAAQTASKKDFIAHIQDKHPDQKVEHETKMTAHPTKSQAEVIDHGIRVIGWAYGLEGRESAFEAMASLALDADCEREGFDGMSNRQAYDMAVARGEVTK